MKYIDADRLRKEVKRLEKAAHRSTLGSADSETRKFHEGKDYAYQHIGILIDSLPDEPANEDIEKELESFVKENIPYEKGGYGDMMRIARHFAEWQKEQDREIIDAAVRCAGCYYLEVWNYKLPSAMEELDTAIKKYERRRDKK